jgi:hypothetical protein
MDINRATHNPSVVGSIRPYSAGFGQFPQVHSEFSLRSIRDRSFTLDGNFIISSTGVDFSSPRSKVSKNSKFRWKSLPTLESILRERGNHSKRVTAVSPRYPPGFRQV